MPPNTSAPLPDEALVVRGGQNTPELISRKYDTHPSGVKGVSVHSAPGTNAEELAVGIPNGQIGVTTVGRVRAAGGDVVRTHGRSPHQGRSAFHIAPAAPRR